MYEIENKSPFVFIPDDPLIACVGNNGGTDDYDIFRGFAKTVDIIYNSSKLEGFVEDVMVYPMVFCARHSIELGLKILINELIKIYSLNSMSKRVEIDEDQLKKDMCNHDIEQLTKHLQKLLFLDCRFKGKFELIEPLFSDYYFDKKGDMFRYAKSLDGTNNLESVNIMQVGLTQLYARFEECVNQLVQLYDLVCAIYYEYKQGTYTLTLSRYEIEEIAKELPNVDYWNDLSFDEVKVNIKNRHNISGNELSSVISCIKQNPYLSAFINQEIIITEISVDELILYAENVAWYDEIINNNVEKIHVGPLSVDTMPRDNNIYLELSSKYEPISYESLIKIYAYEEMGRGMYYCEQFQKVYDYVSESKRNRMDLIRKISRKDMFKFVLEGLRICGQISYLEILTNNHFIML